MICDLKYLTACLYCFLAIMKSGNGFKCTPMWLSTLYLLKKRPTLDYEIIASTQRLHQLVNHIFINTKSLVLQTRFDQKQRNTNTYAQLLPQVKLGSNLIPARLDPFLLTLPFAFPKPNVVSPFLHFSDFIFSFFSLLLLKFLPRKGILSG